MYTCNIVFLFFSSFFQEGQLEHTWLFQELRYTLGFIEEECRFLYELSHRKLESKIHKNYDTR